MKAIGVLTALVLALAMSIMCCDDGKDEDNDKPDPHAIASGDACETEKAKQCGGSTEGADAVLMCIKGGGGLIWTESQVCAKYQTCLESEAGAECEINCDSAWLCEGRECGDDGCGGSCGGCPAGANCLGGVCMEYVCEPQCEGSACGPNGCGGDCGQCAGAQVCDPLGYQCGPIPVDCVPNCETRECGPNGCGGSCGLCQEGMFCMPGAQSCEGACVPSCEGKECGDDGCGGSCGGCLGEGLFCTDGQCKPCDPVLNLGCPEDSYCTFAGSDGPLCEVAGMQGYGEPCGGMDTCKEGVCISLSSSEGGALCYQICYAHSDCGEGNQCMQLQDSKYNVCSVGAKPNQKCNLLTQDCELGTDACYFDSNANEPICVTAGTLKVGQSCSGQPSDCAPGLTCLSTSGGGWICRQFCNAEKGKEPMCDPEGPTPICTNYYAKQKAGYCKED